MARQLAGMFRGLYTGTFENAGTTAEDAETSYAELVAGQRALYGSLAACDEGEAR